MARTAASPAPATGRSPVASKNIVVLCDGTANQVTVYSRTNVLRLARRLDKSSGGSGRQVVFYDPGLGTESAPGALTPVGRAVTRLLGLAFGYGLSKNLADAYAFLMQHYEPGDRIYVFGFSRGAYTARALVGLLGRVGLLERGSDSLIAYAIRYYLAKDSHQLNFFKQRFSRTYGLAWREVEVNECSALSDRELEARVKKLEKERKKLESRDEEIPAELERMLAEAKRAGKPSKGVIPVHFLGVWDTVESIGVLRRQITLPDTDWLPNLVSGRHAVALDEKRSQYEVDLWTADTDSGHDARKDALWWRRQTCLHRDIETMWFAGAHADVGGGYGLPARLEREVIETKEKLIATLERLAEVRDGKERESLGARRKEIEEKRKSLEARNEEVEKEETGLAHIALQWMMEGAEKHGLLFDRDVAAKSPLTPNPRAKLHDPLLPFWWLLGWRPRTIPADARVHPSVQQRIRDCPGYEPAARESGAAAGRKPAEVVGDGVEAAIGVAFSLPIVAAIGAVFPPLGLAAFGEVLKRGAAVARGEGPPR